MRLNLPRIQLLVPSGKVDDGIFSSLVSQIKVSNQTLLFETDLIPEGTIRDLAVQIGQEFPDVVASEAEVKEAALKAADVKAGAERFAWWCNVGKNGKRLAKITFNRDRIFDFLEKHNKGLGAATIDEACAALDASLQWEQVSAPAPAQTPPAPPPPRKLENGEVELPIDASDSQMRNASVEQLRDLDARRRNPSRQKFEPVTQGSDNSRQLMAPKHEFPPMPPEVTRKELINCSREKFEKYRQRYGVPAIDARLQGRG